MSDELATELRKIKRELSTYKLKLKETLEFNERLRSSVGYEELEGWQPQKRIEQQYGWVFAWLHPLSSYMNQNLNKPLTPEVRNKIHNIVMAIIAQLAIYGKYGIKLPHDPREVDLDQFSKKQKNIFQKSYEPCAICGEKRITHECHIIPRSEGGPLHRDNFVMLCPLHHHLFDHSRLSKSEWDMLVGSFNEKMDAAVLYAYQARLPMLRAFWQQADETEDKNVRSNLNLDIKKTEKSRIPLFSWDFEDYKEADLWLLMAFAYQESSVHLFAEMMEGKLENTFHHAKVAVGLMEHAIEIFLKGGIVLAGKEVPKHHHLNQLFGQYKNLYPGKRLCFTCTVNELVEPSKQTPNNQYARYPTNKEGKPWEGYTHIDLAIWYKQAVKLLDDFQRLEPVMKEKYPDEYK
ncbi:MAG: HNH endonuclease [Desulfobacterales bacterium]|nr:HNH endonuclease [Desulfobacterales bacterium]